MKIKEKLADIQENVPLAPLTTFRLGGQARYLYPAKSKEEIIEAVKVAKESSLPFFILGGGSNLLVADKGFDGLVIKVRSSMIKVKNETIGTESGVILGQAVTDSAKTGLTGLEWAVGIPGTVGGAIHGNAGAFGQHFAEVVEQVEIMDENSQIRVLGNKDCQFNYRDSIFKHRPWVILEAVLKLKKGDLARSQNLTQEYLRRRRIPSHPSAGSVFKNIAVSNLPPETRKIVPKEKIKGGMVPTGYLIEQCGLKGRKVGGAKIFEKHANFIVNLGEAKASEVIELIRLCKERVKEKFAIELEEEICYLGF